MNRVIKVALFFLAILASSGWRTTEIHFNEFSYANDVERRLVAGYGITNDNKWKAIVWIYNNGEWKGYTLFDSMLMSQSEASATDGKRVGGYIKNIQGRINAVIWDKIPSQSFINLHPDGFNHSRLNDMTTKYQVGFVITSLGKYRAALWNNSAESFVDLHQFLPSEFTESTALGVSSDNTKVIGFALSDNKFKAVVWSVD